MSPDPSTIVASLFEKHIAGTPEKAIVVNQRVLLCRLTQAVVAGCQLAGRRVYINTWVIKHLYDKKPAEEFECLKHNLYFIVRYPEKAYHNKAGKRGDITFTKTIKNQLYLCSLETLTTETGSTESLEMAVVTAFRLRKGKEGYLKDNDLIWQWPAMEPNLKPDMELEGRQPSS